MDLDNTSTVDATELYAAVLLLYVKLAAFVRGLKPPSAAQVKHIMSECDTNGTGELDRDEFTALAMILLESLAGRVMLQAVFAFVLAPVAASLMLRWYCWLYPPHWVWSYIVPSGVGTTIITTILVSVVVPPLLDKYEERNTQRVAQQVSAGFMDDKKSN